MPSPNPAPMPEPARDSVMPWRSVRNNLLVCLAIALLLTGLAGDPFSHNLLFSVCIGLAIQGLVELGRWGLARALWRLGRRDDALTSGWPGWRWMAPWVMLSAVLGYEIGALLAGWILGLAPQPFAVWRQPRHMALLGLVTLGASLGLTYHFYNLGRLAAAERAAEAARRQASEHQLRLLQSQLEPHLLFNTLANLRVLIGMDPARAQHMLDRLIGWLRATLAASRADTHPLAAEFERLHDYLALMAIRMGPRLQVQLDLPEPLRGLPVPPLLLQPLVENAIQHGLEPKVEGGRLQVSARQQGAQLLLAVRDTGVGLADAARFGNPAPRLAPGLALHAGFGTVQVRERLHSLYGAAASLAVVPADDAEGGTLAVLTLPCPAPCPPH